MNLYLDTSALVKIFIREDFSEEVRKSFVNSDIIAINNIGFVEFFSAINRLKRESLIRNEQYEQIRSNFIKTWNSFLIVETDQNLIESASHLLSEHDLRAFDAIHLASALFLNKNNYKLTFCCFDKKLVDASIKAGLEQLL